MIGCDLGIISPSVSTVLSHLSVCLVIDSSCHLASQWTFILSPYWQMTFVRSWPLCFLESRNISVTCDFIYNAEPFARRLDDYKWHHTHHRVICSCSVALFYALSARGCCIRLQCSLMICFPLRAPLSLAKSILQNRILIHAICLVSPPLTWLHCLLLLSTGRWASFLSQLKRHCRTGRLIICNYLCGLFCGQSYLWPLEAVAKFKWYSVI